MKDTYIIAEAAQGYEGSVDFAKLLVKGAAFACADAIKFQIIYADDLAEKKYQYYDLFCSLEMSQEQWREIRDYAKELELDFVVDVFGQKTLSVAKSIGVDAIKLHSTTFYDEALLKTSLDLGCPLYLSIGGIESGDVSSMVQKYDLAKKDVCVLYGFQSEPTPVESNNLLRIPALCQALGLNVGFMDHSDGGGLDRYSLSAVALGLGVTVFEKHISLDRGLELEDYISALAPSQLKEYVTQIRHLSHALGSPALELTSDEKAYAGRALKRVIAARDIPEGHVVTWDDIRFNRHDDGQDAYNDPKQVLEMSAQRMIVQGSPIKPGDLI